MIEQTKKWYERSGVQTLMLGTALNAVLDLAPLIANLTIRTTVVNAAVYIAAGIGVVLGTKSKRVP